MVDKKLINISRLDNVIVRESDEESVGSKGFCFLKAWGLTLDTSSTHD